MVLLNFLFEIMQSVFSFHARPRIQISRCETPDLSGNFLVTGKHPGNGLVHFCLLDVARRIAEPLSRLRALGNLTLVGGPLCRPHPVRIQATFFS